MARYGFVDVDTNEAKDFYMSFDEYQALERDDSGLFVIEGRKYQRHFKGNNRAGSGGWPIFSDSAGCHPDQIPEMQKFLKERGAPADYTPDGRVIFRDRAHRRRVCRALGLFDRDGGYGDAQRRH